MNLLNLIEDQTSGYNNLRALMQAVDASSDATLNLGGEPITLTYPEARFMVGKYKAYNKAGRQAEFIRDLGDARQFDLHMKQLRDLIQKQKDFRGSIPGERGVGDTVEEIATPVQKKNPLNIGMLNWTRMLKAFDENRPTVDLEFDGSGQPLTVYRPQMEALFIKAKKMTNAQQQELVMKLADRFETIEYIDFLRRKGMIPAKPAYNKPEIDPKQSELPFEAKKKESDKLDRDTAVNPKIQRAFQLARGRNPAAGSDFEAFVQDELQRAEKVQQELERVQADNQEQEDKINKLSAAIAQMARTEPAVAPAIPAKAPTAEPKKEPQAEPRAAEPKAEPKKEPAKPEAQPQTIPQPVPRQRPSQQAEPAPAPTPVPEPEVAPEVPDNVIQFPGLQLPGTEVGQQPERRKRRRAAESVEIIGGEFQGQSATVVESKRHFVTVDIEGFGRHVIHESRLVEMQTDINRFNIDQPMLPSGIAKVKYARDHNIYNDSHMQESLRPGEWHDAEVTFDDGSKVTVRIPSDEGFRDLIIQHFAKQGKKVVDIDVDWSVQGPMEESQLDEKQDACYHKVKSRYKVWPSAYASGALVQCRKKGAANWGTGGKKKK